MIRYALAFLACSLSGPLYGSIAFSSTFDSDPAGLNQTPAGWTVQSGSVDILNNGEYSVPCYGGAGRCVDLDGSTGQGGTLASVLLFDLQPGSLYTLNFYLAGSRWITPDTVTVSFGGVTQVIDVLNWSPMTQYTLVVAPVVPLLGQQIVFSNAGGDNNGAILDQVTLSVETPEPSAILLTATGLGLLAAFRKRRRPAVRFDARL